MKPGQVLTGWWQQTVLGRLLTPQAVYRTALAENIGNTTAADRFIGGPPDDTTQWLAPERLKVGPAFFTGDGYLRQSHRADWQHADPRLMRWAALYVEYARKRGVPLYVHCALRTEAEQAAVNAQGNSKAAYPRSAHNIGEAVDVVHSVYHWDMTAQEWAYLHVLGLNALHRINATLKNPGPKVPLHQTKLHLTWGGHFKTLYDPAHWEVADYRNRIQRLPVGPPVRYTPRAILARFKA